MSSLHAHPDGINPQHVVPALADATPLHRQSRGVVLGLAMLGGLTTRLDAHNYAIVKMVPGEAELNCTVKVSPLLREILDP